MEQTENMQNMQDYFPWLLVLYYYQFRINVGNLIDKAMDTDGT